jgi:predicted nucleotidyltransferase
MRKGGSQHAKTGIGVLLPTLTPTLIKNSRIIFLSPFLLIDKITFLYYFYIEGDKKQMRLLSEEKEAIREAVAMFDSEADVYLFGSRVDDTKKGGDIDILVISDKIDSHSLFLIEEEIFKQIEEQKIDFVLSGGERNNPFANMILKKGVVKL